MTHPALYSLSPTLIKISSSIGNNMVVRNDDTFFFNNTKPEFKDEAFSVGLSKSLEFHQKRIFGGN